MKYEDISADKAIDILYDCTSNLNSKIKDNEMKLIRGLITVEECDKLNEKLELQTHTLSDVIMRFYKKYITGNEEVYDEREIKK